MADSYDHVFRIILIGDTQVGKTCLLEKFITNKFSVDNEVTIGVDFKIASFTYIDDKFIDYNFYGEGKSIRLQIWDTAGQERFNSITTQYYKNVDGAVLCYDVSNILSFLNVRTWIKRLKKENENIIFMIVGTKSDKPHQITSSLIHELADQYKCDQYLTSAKTGENIQLVFYELIRKLIKAGKGKSNIGDIEISPNNSEKTCCAIL